MRRMTLAHRGFIAVACAAVLLVSAGSHVRADDTFLFEGLVPPNVILALDTSGSMKEIMYHPAYDILGWPFQRSDGFGVCDVIPDDFITRSPNDVDDW